MGPWGKRLLHGVQRSVETARPIEALSYGISSFFRPSSMAEEVLPIHILSEYPLLLHISGSKLIIALYMLALNAMYMSS